MRAFFCDDDNWQRLKWGTLLTKIDNLYPGKLLCVHICKTSLNDVRFLYNVHTACTLTISYAGNCWFDCWQDCSNSDAAK